MSRTIAEALEGDGRLPDSVCHVVVIYPDMDRLGITFVNEDDRAMFKAYVETTQRDVTPYAAVARLRALLPPDDLILVFHDRATSRLNDKVFILKITKQLRSVCAACLRETLRARGQITDDDLGLPDDYEGTGLEFSPFVLKRIMSPGLSLKHKG